MTNTKKEVIKEIFNASSDENATKVLVRYIRNLDPLDAVIEIAAGFKQLAAGKANIEDGCKLFDLLVKIKKDECKWDSVGGRPFNPDPLEAATFIAPDKKEPVSDTVARKELKTYAKLYLKACEDNLNEAQERLDQAHKTLVYIDSNQDMGHCPLPMCGEIESKVNRLASKVDILISVVYNEQGSYKWY